MHTIIVTRLRRRLPKGACTKKAGETEEIGLQLAASGSCHTGLALAPLSQRLISVFHLALSTSSEPWLPSRFGPSHFGPVNFARLSHHHQPSPSSTSSPSPSGRILDNLRAPPCTCPPSFGIFDLIPLLFFFFSFPFSFPSFPPPHLHFLDIAHAFIIPPSETQPHLR